MEMYNFNFLKETSEINNPSLIIIDEKIRE